MASKEITVGDNGYSNVSFEDLMKPVYAALRKLYRFRRRRNVKEAPYDGYGFHYEIGACSPDPDEQLNAEGLEYDRERGRNAMQVLLRIAFQLGYSQMAYQAHARIDGDRKRADEDYEHNKHVKELLYKEIESLIQRLPPEEKKKEVRKRAAQKAANTRFINNLTGKKKKRA